MSAWLDSDVFVILSTYFTQLESASCIEHKKRRQVSDIHITVT